MRRAMLAALVAWAVRAQDMGGPKTNTEKATPPTQAAVAGLVWLQPLVDATPEGHTLTLAPGRYSGPVLVTRPIVIDGQGKATITNGNSGTVFVLEAGSSTLTGLTFTGSGDSHNSDDACLNVRGNDNLIDSNVFDDCLFGIDLKQSNRNRVTRNHIRSKDRELGARGDALRLWYSMDNVIEHNTVTDSRDVVVWYSNGNVIRHNVGRRSRYSLHFMYATHNVVEENDYEGNSVGIYVMYTEGVEIRRNRIAHSIGATGMGIGFKEASDTVLEGNDIIYCGIGISSDLSPYQPDSFVNVRGNHIAYNGIGLSLTGDKPGTVVEDNLFESNLEQVSQSGGGDALRNTWRNNYWDDYQGFDRNLDGVGDTPYELYAFSDQIWSETPDARFFRNAPLMEALDFLERLAPFSSPQIVVRDEHPRFLKPTVVTP